MPMQPRPSVETVRADVVPRVRVVVIVMPTSQRLRARSKSSGPGLVEAVLVEADLVVDGAQVVGDLGELAAYSLAVVEEQPQSLDLVAVAGADQFGVRADLADRHTGRTQLGDQLDPAQVALGVAAVPRRGPADLEHQPVALVVAQRVSGQSGAVGNLGDGEGERRGRHPVSVTPGVRSKSNGRIPRRTSAIQGRTIELVAGEGAADVSGFGVV